MKKQHARAGVVGSLLLHSALFAGVWWTVNLPQPIQPNEQLTSISMEMMAALLEQPQVATAPDPVPEAEPIVEEISAPEPEPIAEPEPTPEPVPEPVVQKPIEKPQEKPKPKEKPKEKPKKEKEKPKTEKPKVKAVEKSDEVKQGIVAKALPNAVNSDRTQLGSPTGSPNANAASGAGNQSSAGSASEINAYKALLQRNLQRRADNSYPAREKMMRRTGIVTLSFSVSSSGQVINVKVINSSGNANLDAAALKAAQSTTMKSPPPVGFPTSLTVPIKFNLE